MSEATMLNQLHAEGYRNIRLLPTGEWAATLQMIFTTGLFVGLDETGYRTRFCYETEHEAKQALEQWDGNGFPPGWWVKQKPEDVPNPAMESTR